MRPLLPLLTPSSLSLQFVKFAEQLEQIDIARNQRLGDLQDDEAVEEGSCFFAHGLDKWRELDCSAAFSAFVREVQDKGSDLTLLLVNKEQIVALLLSHLRVPDSLAHPALLDLVVQLARDLRDDFEPFFERFFLAMLDVASPPSRRPVSSKLLEQVFTAMAFCCKLLRRSLTSKLDAVFGLVLRFGVAPIHHKSITLSHNVFLF